MSDNHDDEINRLRIALGRISRMIDRHVAGGGLTRTELSVLGTVARNKTLGMGELADTEGLNPTMLSRIVGKLENAGLLRRAPGADDRRAVVVEITGAGSRLHTKLRKQRTKLLGERLEALPADQFRALMTAVPALETLAHAMKPAEPAKPGDAVTTAQSAPPPARSVVADRIGAGR